MIKKVAFGVVLAVIMAATAALPATAKTKHMSGGMKTFHDQVMTCMASMKDMGSSVKDTGHYMAMLSECVNK